MMLTELLVTTYIVVVEAGKADVCFAFMLWLLKAEFEVAPVFCIGIHTRHLFDVDMICPIELEWL